MQFLVILTHQWPWQPTPTYDCTSGCRYSCIPDDGRVCRPKHVQWTKQRNKIHCIQLHLLVISISCTPDDGRVCRPKHVEWTKQRNKIHCIQLHLLVILISCTPDDGRVCRPKHAEWTKQRNKTHCIQLHLLVISIEHQWPFCPNLYWICIGKREAVVQNTTAHISRPVHVYGNKAVVLEIMKYK